MPYRVLATKKLRYGGEYIETEVIREYSPCRRTIKIQNKFVNLPFPYIVFYWTNPELYVGFAKKPITSVRSLLYAAPLGNVYEYGRVCGCGAYRTKKGDQSVIARAIDLFWNKAFTLSEGTIGPNSLEATFDEERRKKEKKYRQRINDNDDYDYDFYGYGSYGYGSYIPDNLLLSWSKLKPEQIIRKLYYCPRTFKGFLASPLSGEYDDDYDVLPRDIVSELNLKLTLDSEYQQLYVPNISKKRRGNRAS